MENEEPPRPPRRRRFRTGRLEAFSDGVFAIAITLLVLDIAVSGDAGLNLLLLLVISFLPFPTRLFADYIRQTSAERVAVTFYGIIISSRRLSARLLRRKS
jgi:uncharacterized membrane protein